MTMLIREILNEVEVINGNPGGFDISVFVNPTPDLMSNMLARQAKEHKAAGVLRGVSASNGIIGIADGYKAVHAEIHGVMSKRFERDQLIDDWILSTDIKGRGHPTYELQGIPIRVSRYHARGVEATYPPPNQWPEGLRHAMGVA